MATRLGRVAQHVLHLPLNPPVLPARRAPTGRLRVLLRVRPRPRPSPRPLPAPAPARAAAARQPRRLVLAPVVVAAQLRELNLRTHNHTRQDARCLHVMPPGASPAWNNVDTERRARKPPPRASPAPWPAPCALRFAASCAETPCRNGE